MRSIEFRKINFGYAGAEKEAAKSPGLLVDGYIDLHDACKNVFDSDEFLVLGYKGSGKSGILERLKLLHQGDSQVFITSLNLGDFPYSAFSKIVKTDEAPQARYPVAWGWLLLIYAIASLNNDQGKSTHLNCEFDETTSALKQMGLFPAPGLSRMVQTTTETGFKLAIPTFFEGTRKVNASSADIPAYVENLKKLISSVRSDSKHLIIIDGLDEIVTNKIAQWSSLGSLVFEVNRINTDLRKDNCPVKIVLLCRTDIFELLDGPNKNKIRQDSAIELDWYQDPNSPRKSMLVKIANTRASLSLGHPVDIFQDLLPKRAFRRDTAKALLECTRHTPRDFLQLLKHVQACCDGEQVRFVAIRNGMRKYSQDYFLPEIFDELQGYIEANYAKDLFKLIGALRSRDFYAADVHSKADAEQNGFTKDKIDIALSALFECSAIGNIQIRSNKTQFITFRYRNPHATFNIKERLILHRGLWRALNLPQDSSWDDEGSDEDER